MQDQGSSALTSSTDLLACFAAHQTLRCEVQYPESRSASVVYRPCGGYAAWAVTFACPACWYIRTRFWCQVELDDLIARKIWICGECKAYGVKMRILGDPVRLRP